MACKFVTLFVSLCVAPCAGVAVVRGSAFLAADDAEDERMHPDVVAKTLARVEEEWKEQATIFTECNASLEKSGCKDVPASFARSCATVVSAVVQGSSGKRGVASEYMANVCSQKTLASWQKLRCTDLADAIVNHAMTADSYANREKLDSAKLCGGFWSKFVEAERKREVQEAAERAARQKKEAEEAAASKKRAEKAAAAARKKAQEEARAEGERRAKEEARKAREAKEQEAKRKAAEAKARAAEAAARLAQKKAEAEAIQKAAQQKLEEASKAEKEHLQLQAEHQKAEEHLRNTKKMGHITTNSSKEAAKPAVKTISPVASMASKANETKVVPKANASAAVTEAKKAAK